MRLLLLRSLWTNGFDLPAALGDCRTGAFDGVEGPLPEDSEGRRVFIDQLRSSGFPFVAEITTGGGYVPQHRSRERHLDEFKRKAEAARAAAPLFLTVLAGCDAWPIAESIAFYEAALEFVSDLGLTASFETHRSRPTFTPWATRELLVQVPHLQLTCDFSHWCCVTERLVLDEEPELLALLAQRTHHIHARIGYDQGPQVPHPAAPEHAAALAAHERWWDQLWDGPTRADQTVMTMTPEFGPDGYLQAAPFTQKPVADLNEINHWMAARQRERFSKRAVAA